MPSSFCEPSTGNSDSEPGLPSQKPKEQQRSVLRPAVLQAPQPKAFSQMVLSSGTNGVNVPPDSAATSESPSNATLKSSDSEDKLGDESDETADVQNAGLPTSDVSSATNYFLQYISSSVENSTNSADTSSNKFVFGQNMSERVLASSKDTGQLYAALHHRILALRSRVEQEQEVKNVAPEPEVTQSNEEDSDDDVIAPSGSVGSGPNDEGDGQNVGST
ncbi:ran-binding protein 3 isoform x2 [Limosa lapponica baueri]|uniref:Ran-binding protein 3 isoform x2 n=1 Tax=Limosa lapponica baueri TaxID=1758121 RepID=A0A2I0TFM0_LIMLA|nr:ran-binding protein 3 isoform x2 [Limosa lapponica baueri]